MTNPGMVLGRITITRYLTDDGDDRITYDTEGDADHVVTVLGMLRITEDTLLHAPDQEDDS